MSSIGNYINKDSLIHNLHPLIKNCIFIFSFIAGLLTNNPIILLILFLITVGVGFMASLPVAQSLRTLKNAALIIVLFSLLIWPFTLSEGTVLLELWNLNIYSTGLLYGISVSLRFSIIVLMSIYWMMFTSIGEITLGFVKLKIPYKFAFSFSMAFRFVPLVLKDLSIIREAQQSRAFDFGEGTILEKIKKNTALLVPLSSKSLGTINEISTALESRGFGAYDSRSYIQDAKMSRIDYAILLLMILIIIILIYFRVNGLFLLTDSVL